MSGEMAEYDCQGVFAQMYAFFDNELDEQTLVLVQQHLQECESCEDSFTFEQRLRVTIRRCCSEQAPESLRAKIERLRAQGEGSA